MTAEEIYHSEEWDDYAMKARELFPEYNDEPYRAVKWVFDSWEKAHGKLPSEVCDELFEMQVAGFT